MRRVVEALCRLNAAFAASFHAAFIDLPGIDMRIYSLHLLGVIGVQIGGQPLIRGCLGATR
jgi:hypothetical protein